MTWDAWAHMVVERNMQDEMKDAIEYGTFYQVEIENEGFVNFKPSDYTVDEVMALTGADEVEQVTGYFIEAPDEDGLNYWIGPFDSEEDLIEHMEDMLSI